MGETKKLPAMLVPMTEEAAASYRPLTQERIAKAVETGRRHREAAEARAPQLPPRSRVRYR